MLSDRVTLYRRLLWELRLSVRAALGNGCPFLIPLQGQGS